MSLLHGAEGVVIGAASSPLHCVRCLFRWRGKILPPIECSHEQIDHAEEAA